MVYVQLNVIIVANRAFYNTTLKIQGDLQAFQHVCIRLVL